MPAPSNGTLKNIVVVISLCIGVSGFTAAATAWRWSGLCDDVRACQQDIVDIRLARAEFTAAMSRDMTAMQKDLAEIKELLKEANYR